MKKYVIIAAGGSGIRMGNETPKQFLELRDKPVLWHSVKAFADAFSDISIIVVVPSAHLEKAGNICSGFNNIELVEGGSSRFQSVKNGLKKVEGDAIVFVHDAVRCLVTKELILRCYEQALHSGSAIPSVIAGDTIRIVEGNSHKVINRDQVRMIQTPQTFRSDIILPAFETGEKEQFTDEATVVEASGRKVELTEGEYINIKITRPFDLLIAEKILEERSSFEPS